MKRVVSAIQPSNCLHLSNYIGAIKQWLMLQSNENYQCFFGIADLHSLTINPGNFVELRSLDTCYQLLACGLNAKQVSLFRQSRIPSIMQIYWKLACITNFNWLQGMAHLEQKMKLFSSKGLSPAIGLFSYPILMAADIVALKGVAVPVGADQKQHIEFTRKLVSAANSIYTDASLDLPVAVYPTECKIMSLLNAKEKMSKSTANQNESLFLLDSFESIGNKITKATTDARGKVVNNPFEQPEITNLLRIFSSISDIPIEVLVERYKDCKSYKKFKQDLIKCVCDFLGPIQERYAKIKQNN